VEATVTPTKSETVVVSPVIPLIVPLRRRSLLELLTAHVTYA
jgi:hypothetical protein